MRIKRYHLASGSDLQSLETEVNKLLAEGWQPVGQVVVSKSSNGSPQNYVQTLVQYEGEIRS